jgi:hypothetical protein
MNRLLLTILALLGLYSWSVGRWARRRVTHSPELRTLFLWSAFLAIPVGACIAFLLPEQIPFNRESPAGIFTVYLPCFVIGGGLAFGGVGAFFGALAARPQE